MMIVKPLFSVDNDAAELPGSLISFEIGENRWLGFDLGISARRRTVLPIARFDGDGWVNDSNSFYETTIAIDKMLVNLGTSWALRVEWSRISFRPNTEKGNLLLKGGDLYVSTRGPNFYEGFVNVKNGEYLVDVEWTKCVSCKHWSLELINEHSVEELYTNGDPLSPPAVAPDIASMIVPQ